MVNQDRHSVALLKCGSYHTGKLKKVIDALLTELSFSVSRGTRVLLKPNLVSGKSNDGLACTNSEFVAVIAEWFLDHGAIVAVGDSPAFGSAKHVMKVCGIAEALRKLPVSLLDFKKKRLVKLECGVSIGMAADVFECDQLVNLPKLKAHNQMLVTMAVKNLFGTVLGCRKALAHMRYGERQNLFAELMVDLLNVVPTAVNLIDGVRAMHLEGPITGQAFDVGVVGASRNPVALDSAFLDIIGVKANLSPLWQECKRRRFPGTDSDSLNYPIQTPSDLAVEGFIVPQDLDPVRFQLGRFLTNGFSKILRNLSKKN